VCIAKFICIELNTCLDSYRAYIVPVNLRICLGGKGRGDAEKGKEMQGGGGGGLNKCGFLNKCAYL